MASKKILIVIDVQNDFITDALRNEEAIKTLPNIVNLVKNEKFDETYVTMDTHDKDYLNTLEGRKLPVPHCIKNTNGWKMPVEMVDALKNQNVVQVFEKPTFGSVWMNDFIRSLANNNHNEYLDAEFTIVGFVSSICVMSNAILLRAKFPNNKIIVRKDCTCGITNEDNEASMTVLKMQQIEIL